MIISKSKSNFLYTLVLVNLLSSCGNRTDDGSHYDEDFKRFKDDAHQTEDTHGKERTDSNSLSPINTDSSENTPVDPARVVFRSSFEGVIVKSSVKLIKASVMGDVSLIQPESSNIFKMVEEFKVAFDSITSKPISLIAEQTYGNKSGSIFTQTIKSPTDASPGETSSTMFTGDSASGKHVYHRIASSELCPASFVCIDRVNVTPERGSLKTFCYRDAKTGKPTAIPIGAAPGASRADLSTIGSKFGPYYVEVFTSGEVDCQNTTYTPNQKTEIEILVQVEEKASDLAHISASSGGLKVDYGIAFNVMKKHNGQRLDDNKVPYIDTLTGLQAKTVYYFNDNDRSLVRIKKEIRRPIQLQYGMGTVTGYQGILAVLEFKFCKDQLKSDSPDYCSTAPTTTAKN